MCDCRSWAKACTTSRPPATHSCVLGVSANTHLATGCTILMTCHCHLLSRSSHTQLYTLAAVEQAVADVLELLPPSAALMSDSGVALLVAPPPLQPATSAAAAAAAAAPGSPQGRGGFQSTGGGGGGGGGGRGGGGGGGGSVAKASHGHGVHSHRLNVGLLGYPDGGAGPDTYDSRRR